MEVQLSYNGEVPSPPPLTPLPVMAVEIHRGALALLAWIRSPATSQIIVHLLNLLVSFAGCKVYLSWCTYRYLDIAMKAHPIFWGSWMVTIIVILAILLSFHISQSDIWQISTLWYLTNFHTLVFDEQFHALDNLSSRSKHNLLFLTFCMIWRREMSSW